MKIWCISDVHNLHNQLQIPKDIDGIIVAGDISNPKDKWANETEVKDFLYWISLLTVDFKILVAGNHDTSIFHGLIKRDHFDKAGVIYLENQEFELAGIPPIKIWGSPMTPTHGDWAFMKDRSKLDRYWQCIPDDTQILITHGPPKGVLDLSRNPDGDLELCGDNALLNHVRRVKPKYHIFGHIHNYKDCINQGVRVIDGTTFVNASCVVDGKFKEGPSSHGVVIEI